MVGEMLEHDLSYPWKKRLHCCNCRMELEHYNTGLVDGFTEGGERCTLVQMECRVCDEVTAVPVAYLGSGILSRLIVRR